jgi:hypothetical protein
LFIQPWHVVYGEGSETELAADLAPGDTEVVLVDASGWSDDVGEQGSFRNMVMYPYTDGLGESYEPYTYSRLTQQVPAEGLWAPGSVEGNTITLLQGWNRPNPDDPDGVWRAGTKVANAHGGATFNYVLAANAAYTSDWTEYSGVVSGVASGGLVPADQFRPGTAFIRFAVAPNRDISGSRAQYTNVEIRDVTAPITYEPAPGFTGTDTFTYTISDGNGGTSTATVTVEVSG